MVRLTSRVNLPPAPWCISGGVWSCLMVSGVASGSDMPSAPLSIPFVGLKLFQSYLKNFAHHYWCMFLLIIIRFSFKPEAAAGGAGDRSISSN